MIKTNYKKLQFILLSTVFFMVLLNIFIIVKSISTLSEYSSISLRSNYMLNRFILNITQLNNEIVNNHNIVTKILEEADEKNLSHLTIYRAHTRIVDNLSELSKKLDTILVSDIIEDDYKNTIRKIKNEFESYRSHIIMTTDIVSIDHNQAQYYIIKAQDYFINYTDIFNEFISIVSSKTSEEIRINYEKNKLTFNQQLIISVVGILIVLSITGLIIWKINRIIIQLLKNEKHNSNILKQLNLEKTELIATKDKFFKIIAHDLKSPFQPIFGFTRLLQTECKKSTQCAEQLEYIEIIKNSSEQAFKLLNDLLDWAKIQTGEIKYNPENNNVEMIIGEVVVLLQQQAKLKNITLNYEVNSDLTGYFDSNMVVTALRNIVSNAIKFTNNGGKVSIISKIDANNNFIQIKIVDNGVGIPPDKVKKILDITSKHTTKGTNGEVGTGLGLILCKEFIEKNNGNIKVESELNKGTVFTVKLPLTS